MKIEPFVIKWILFLAACALFISANIFLPERGNPDAVYTGAGTVDQY